MSPFAIFAELVRWAVWLGGLAALVALVHTLRSNLGRKLGGKP